jgi:endonuclease/exonuclease/phosphatase family metal-dependent hydrolase
MGIENTRRLLKHLLCPLLLAVLNLAAAQCAAAEPFLVLSQNMNRLFDDIDDGNNEKILSKAAFRARITQAAHKFSRDFALPQVIALQEVENVNVVQQIAAQMRQHYATDYRVVLIPGQDISAINLAFMVQADIEIRKTQQLFREQRLPVDGSPLFSRPPLYLEACYRARCLSLLNLHLRSMRGIDDAERGERVARKRLHQAETIAIWANRYQRVNSESLLMILGDFNALTPADKHVDVAGIIRGNPDNRRTRLASSDLLNPDLIDLTRRIPAPRRYSYIFRQKKQQLDYMFANQALTDTVETIAFAAIDYSFSDHAGLLVRHRW